MIFALAADLAHHVDDDFLVACVEADQRLVEQQQLRLADQRLRQQQPLPLAARHVGQRPRGEIAGADRVERFLDHAAVVLTDRRQAPSLAVERARDEIAPAHSQVRQDRAQLRQIADRRIAALGRAPEYLHAAAFGRSNPRIARINVVLPAPLGPSTPMNSPASIAKLTSASTVRLPMRSVT